MFNISKAYVRLLGHALGYHFSSKDGFDVDVLGPGEYIDIVRVYEWLNDLTAKVEDPDLGLKAFGNAHRNVGCSRVRGDVMFNIRACAGAVGDVPSIN